MRGVVSAASIEKRFWARVDKAVSVKVASYVVSRIPDTSANHLTWSIRVEASGHGRWAVRWMGQCLAKDLEWEHEPLPSSRSDEWLDTVRWDNVDEAIDAALAVEQHLKVNGLTPADVLARMAARSEATR